MTVFFEGETELARVKYGGGETFPPGLLVATDRRLLSMTPRYPDDPYSIPYDRITAVDWQRDDTGYTIVITERDGVEPHFDGLSRREAGEMLDVIRERVDTAAVQKKRKPPKRR
jgi:hypothetical protein